MMSRICQYILLVFFLIVAISPKFMVLAEETRADGIIMRPVMEYKSGGLRDPFKTYIVKEEPKAVTSENAELSKQPELDLDNLKVQGIIWGVKAPQAIINDKVLTIGDFIEGAEIIGIEKKGITLSFNGAIFDLTAPGQNSAEIMKIKGGIK
jgi:hypothetical protein